VILGILPFLLQLPALTTDSSKGYVSLLHLSLSS